MDDTNTVPRFGKPLKVKEISDNFHFFVSRASSENSFSDKVDDGKEFCIPRTHTLTKVDRVNFYGGDVIGQGSFYFHLERNGV